MFEEELKMYFHFKRAQVFEQINTWLSIIWYVLGYVLAFLNLMFMALVTWISEPFTLVTFLKIYGAYNLVELLFLVIFIQNHLKIVKEPLQITDPPISYTTFL